MNGFTQEEKEVLSRIKKPLVSFEEIQIAMDKEVQKDGYDNLEDFLVKTGWYDRSIV